MNSVKAFVVTASLCSLCLPGLASAACSQSTDITNLSNVTLRFVELKSSYSPPFFKSQWTGLRTIAPGATETINWTSDLNCNDASGVPNVFDIKLYRSIGKVHYCGRLEPNQAVSVDAPDLCL